MKMVEANVRGREKVTCVFCYPTYYKHLSTVIHKRGCYDCEDG